MIAIQLRILLGSTVKFSCTHQEACSHAKIYLGCPYEGTRVLGRILKCLGCDFGFLGFCELFLLISLHVLGRLRSFLRDVVGRAATSAA